MIKPELIIVICYYDIEYDRYYCYTVRGDRC